MCTLEKITLGKPSRSRNCLQKKCMYPEGNVYKNAHIPQKKVGNCWCGFSEGQGTDVETGQTWADVRGSKTGLSSSGG